jgi:carboxymethylenebutenolidase
MGVKATVMYYGQFGHDDLSHMKATIIGHFGEKDTNIKVDNVKEFQAALKTQNGNNEVYIYPNAGHGFANPSGANYNEEAADLAWQRTMDFLQKNL